LLPFFSFAIKKQLKKPPKPRFLIRSLSLTPETDATVQQLAQEASDQLGWTIGGSAIVQALVRHAAKQNLTWARKTLFPLSESEIQSGFVWGKKK
jgi:hypothetical protein